MVLLNVKTQTTHEVWGERGKASEHSVHWYTTAGLALRSFLC